MKKSLGNYTELFVLLKDKDFKILFRSTQWLDYIKVVSKKNPTKLLAI